MSKNDWEDKFRIEFELRYDGILPKHLLEESMTWWIVFISPYITHAYHQGRREALKECAKELEKVERYSAFDLKEEYICAPDIDKLAKKWRKEATDDKG